MATQYRILFFALNERVRAGVTGSTPSICEREGQAGLSLWLAVGRKEAKVRVPFLPIQRKDLKCLV